MVLLACTYLRLLHLLALHRYRFTWVLAAAMVIEVAALVAIGDDLTRVAMALMVVQALCAAGVLFLALRPRPASVAPDPVAEPAPMAASLG